MNNTILMIVHQKTSITGRVGCFLEQRGYTLDVRCPMLGHELPQDLQDYAGAAMFGGPMSANDDHLPGIRAELDWLPYLLQAEKPFLGLCLGAQMLARCLGAKVGAHPEGHRPPGGGDPGSLARRFVEMFSLCRFGCICCGDPRLWA